MSKSAFYQVLGKLKNATRHGDKWQARCPAHEDDKASLSISMGEGEKVLCYCHAGCTLESIVTAIGMKVSDLCNGNGTHKIKKEILKIYDYTDENGNLVHQTIRYFPKEFKQRRPDGKGGWIWKLTGITPVIYNLPDVIKAKSVIIVEGEKDADNIQAVGLCSTTSPMGAGKWRPEFNKWFKGKRVAIIPDNDAPGIKHASDIASQLINIAEWVGLVIIPDLAFKGDVSDFLESGADRAKLCEIIKQTPAFDPSVTIVTGVTGEMGCNRDVTETRKYVTETQESLVDWCITQPETLLPHQQPQILTTENLTEKIKNWLEVCDGVFNLRELAQELQITIQSKDYNNLKLILKRLTDQNVLCRVGQRRGDYRKRETDESIMQWWEGEGSDEFNLQLPLDLSDLCKIFPKNIVVIAGTKDAGKTCLSLNIAKANMNQHEVHYYASEMSAPELRSRLSAFKDMDLKAWRQIQFHDVKENFQDHVLRYPDALHIIDFIEIHGDFWEVGGTIRAIFDSLRNGCAILNLQKKRDAEYAKGGEVTIEKARLYLNLDRKFDAQIPYTQAKIVSAKIPRVYGEQPSGMVRNFRIDWGWNIYPLCDWHREAEQENKRWKRH